jgi:hypothetical protein
LVFTSSGPFALSHGYCVPTRSIELTLKNADKAVSGGKLIRAFCCSLIGIH